MQLWLKERRLFVAHRASLHNINDTPFCSHYRTEQGFGASPGSFPNETLMAPKVSSALRLGRAFACAALGPLPGRPLRLCPPGLPGGHPGLFPPAIHIKVVSPFAMRLIPTFHEHVIGLDLVVGRIGWPSIPPAPDGLHVLVDRESCESHSFPLFLRIEKLGNQWDV